MTILRSGASIAVLSAAAIGLALGLASGLLGCGTPSRPSAAVRTAHMPPSKLALARPEIARASSPPRWPVVYRRRCSGSITGAPSLASSVGTHDDSTTSLATTRGATGAASDR